jgi:glutamate/tyrosine decarboxylase-like PLP-dependent enzyme
LEGLANLAAEHDIRLHVDGAYGLAALGDPETRMAFKGIEHADSFIVDPHKWLFAPYDSCALVYRDPIKGAQAHGQQGVYLDTLDHTVWNPSDYALQLTRRARGLPIWFSLVTYGTQAYAQAIAKTV